MVESDDTAYEPCNVWGALRDRMAAINAESNAYIQKQKAVAELARAMTQWFSDKFRHTMLPLSSVQQDVIHLGYFDSPSQAQRPAP